MPWDRVGRTAFDPRAFHHGRDVGGAGIATPWWGSSAPVLVLDRQVVPSWYSSAQRSRNGFLAGAKGGVQVEWVAAIHGREQRPQFRRHDGDHRPQSG